MNRNRLTALKQFLVCQLNHWSLFAVSYGVILINESLIGCGCLELWEWGLAGIIYYLMYMIRKNTKELWISIVLHIPVIAAFAMVPMMNLGHNIVFLIFGVSYAAMSIRHQVINVSMCDHTIAMPVAVGLSLFMLGIQHYFDIYDNDDVCKITIICLIVLYFIQYFLDHYLNFIFLNKDSTGILPAKEIFHSGFGLVTLFTVGTAIILLFSADLAWLNNAIGAVRDNLLQWIRNLLGGMNNAGNRHEEVPSMDSNYPLVMNLPQDETPAWAKVLDYVATVFISVVVALAVFLLVLELIRAIRNLFRRKSSKEELGVIDTYEKVKKEKSRAVKAADDLRGLSPRMKVRRIFKKKVRQEYKEIIGNAPIDLLKRRTSGECETAMHVSGMAGVYDKARYSEERISDEDVRNMKAALKNMTDD